jgi:protein transport protein SEC24
MDNEASAQAQKKKRAYAAAPAYEFGANVGLQQGQPPPMMGPAGMAAPAMPMAGQMGAQPMQGHPMAPQMGMASPPGLIPQDDPLANQFGQMNLQNQNQPMGQQPQQQQQRQTPLAQNQLYPSDLISQPFRVEELDNPPPAINVPPGVRLDRNHLDGLTCTDERHPVSLRQLRPQVGALHPQCRAHDTFPP